MPSTSWVTLNKVSWTLWILVSQFGLKKLSFPIPPFFATILDLPKVTLVSITSVGNSIYDSYHFIVNCYSIIPLFYATKHTVSLFHCICPNIHTSGNEQQRIMLWKLYVALCVTFGHSHIFGANYEMANVGSLCVSFPESAGPTLHFPLRSIWLPCKLFSSTLWGPEDSDPPKLPNSTAPKKRCNLIPSLKRSPLGRTPVTRVLLVPWNGQEGLLTLRISLQRQEFYLNY